MSYDATKVLQQRKVILATIRQDLLAPVNAILGYAEIIRDEFTALEMHTLVADMDKVITASLQLKEMTDGFLDKDVADTIFSGADIEQSQRKLRHDLRTPLNAIKGYSEMVLEDLYENAMEDGNSIVTDLTSLISESDGLLHQLATIVDFTRTIDTSKRNEVFGIRHENSEIVSSLLESIHRIENSRRAIFEQGNILVVDDMKSNRDLLQKRLTRDGHTVYLAENGYQALEMLEKQKFDLILLDLMMPGINGYEVLRKLKHPDSEHLHIPVVMISAMDELDSVIRCIELGAEDYLAKPFNQVLLKARIQSCLEKKRMRDREKLFLEQIQQEKNNSERLLHNILPSPIVSRIHMGEKLIADNFESVSVLFSDLVGFTEISSKMNPETLVRNLNKIFTCFDTLAQELGIEKLKTIGDAYIAVSGLPQERSDHANAMADMALGMISTLDQINHTLDANFKIRIGIHSGPVAAGIIGTHKFVYDIWGDTVNMASRLESNSETNRVHISEQTAAMLGDIFHIEHRGMIPLKGKGHINTYFLNGRRS